MIKSKISDKLVDLDNLIYLSCFNSGYNSFDKTTALLTADSNDVNL